MPDITALTDQEKRRLLTIALVIALELIMTNHIYKFKEEIRRQREGGAIGLELTGQLAKIYMIWWHREYLKKIIEWNKMYTI